MLNRHSRLSAITPIAFERISQGFPEGPQHGSKFFHCSRLSRKIG